jgi:Tol biopolymer transport system component
MKQVFALGTVAAAFALILGCGGSGGGTSSGGGGGGGGGGAIGERTAVSDTVGGRPRVWVHDIKTNAFLQQAESSTARNEMPALSPDASKIAFISNRSGSDELYVMTVNQPSTLQRLTTDSTIDVSPAWISNNRLVWNKFVGGTDSEIVAMNLDGTNFAQLTDNAVDDKLPAVSKNGNTIAFLRAEGGRTHVIYTMPAAGGAPTLVHRHQADRPSVSWNGSSELFFTSVDGDVESCMRISSTGGTAAKMTEGWGPKISPSGTRIMFARLVSGKAEVFTSTLTGSDVRQYTFTAEGVFAWDWEG